MAGPVPDQYELIKMHEATIAWLLPVLTSIWNRSIRKVEMDAEEGLYYRPEAFQNPRPGTSETFTLPSAIRGMFALALQSRQRRFKELSKKPGLTGS